MHGLVNARRKEALELGKALAEARKVAQAADAEAQAAREALVRQGAEMFEKDALLARYRAMLGPIE